MFYNLKVVNPCDEEWENMVPEEKGRYCNLCSKSVIDITNLSEKEIVELLKSSGGNLCARVNSNQLKTPLLDLPDIEKSTYNTNYSRLATGVMLASALAISTPTNAEIRAEFPTEQRVPTNETDDSNDSEQTQPSDTISSDFTVFRGKVILKDTNIAVENAKITFFTLTKTYSTYTKDDGTYELELPNDVIKDKNVVRFSFSESKKIELLILGKGENPIIEGVDNTYSLLNEENLVFSKQELKSTYIFKAESATFFAGGLIYSKASPKIVYDGREVSYKKYQKRYKGYSFKEICKITENGKGIKNKKTKFDKRKQYYFEGEAAIALYGEKAKDGLYLFIDE